MEDLLKFLFATLPINFGQDPFFQDFSSKILFDYKDSKLCGKALLKHSMYDVCLKEFPNLKYYVIPSIKATHLLYFMIKNEKSFLSLKIQKLDKCYDLVCNITDGLKETTLHFEKFLDHSLVQIVTIEKANGKYLDYQNEIYFYDQHYQCIPNKDLEKQIDYEFSNFFYVPIDNSRYYRTHFKKFASQLSERKIIRDMEYDDLTRPLKEKYEFTDPFLLKEFDQVLLDDISHCEEEILIQIKNSFDFHSIEAIQSSFYKFIENGEVVMSCDLYQNIIRYVTGLTGGIISAKGIILKKINNGFILYHIHVLMGKVLVKSENISVEDAQSMALLNEKNLKNDQIKDFFGISRFR